MCTYIYMGDGRVESQVQFGFWGEMWERHKLNEVLRELTMRITCWAGNFTP